MNKTIKEAMRHVFCGPLDRYIINKILDKIDKYEKKIILRGMPGSGKTTLAYVLNKDIKKLKEGSITTNNTPKKPIFVKSQYIIFPYAEFYDTAGSEHLNEANEEIQEQCNMIVYLFDSSKFDKNSKTIFSQIKSCKSDKDRELKIIGTHSLSLSNEQKTKIRNQINQETGGVSLEFFELKEDIKEKKDCEKRSEEIINFILPDN
ncbi:TPA: 50S ribosome-binding GTPase [Campylobacter jejuni]|nr:50S ribosome-binding GTPase [Campylobacter jejuni]